MHTRVWIGVLLASGTLAVEAHAQSATATADRPGSARVTGLRLRVPGTTHPEALDLVEFEVRPAEQPGR